MTTLRLIPETGRSFEIKEIHASVGRDPSCDVVIDDLKVSRRHAAIEWRGRAWFVSDMESANGVFVEGRKVTEARLESGQELRLGTVSFEVQVDSDFESTQLIKPLDVMDATVQMPVGVALRRPPLVKPPIRTKPPAAAPAPQAIPSEEGAAALLGVPRGTPADSVRARYLELTQDLQTKLAHSKNPNLKASYQKNLDAVRRAFAVLVPASATEIAAADLPAVQPVAAPDELIEAVSRRAPLEAPPPPAPAKGAGELLPPATNVLVLAAVVLIALAAFFALSRGKNETAMKARRQAPELISARESATKYAPVRQLLERGVLTNGRLKLCNRASVPLEVAWLGAVYLVREELPPMADRSLADKASGFRVAAYNSKYCAKEFKLELPPRSSREVRLASDIARCSWDGSALFLGIAVQGPGGSDAAEAQPHSGNEAAPATRTVWSGGLVPAGSDCVSIGDGW